jgi:sugar phosphate isomerase/epimerase
MKLGVFIVLYADKTLEEALDTIEKYHFDAVEIGCGGFIPKAHCDPAELLKDKAKLKVFKNELTSRNLILSTLSCHGNVLHPDKSLAAQHEDDLKKAMQLCSELDLDRVVNFSGCPGDGTNAKTPNWITCPWPDYFLETLEWQWNECIIPKWIKLAEYGKRYGVTKICLEMHPGFSVYNPENLLRLRKAVGDSIGSNFDPSHLFWQGIDPVLAVRELKDCIFHVHAKDSVVSKAVASKYGVLETKALGENFDRAWNFKTVGYGHGEEFWRAFIWELQQIGYDHVISIEHEDHQMSLSEGLSKAVGFLRDHIIVEKPGKLWFEKEE